MGGPVTMGRTANILNQDGRMEVFFSSIGNAVGHIWQVAPNNGWNSRWEGRELGACVGNVCAARNGDNRLEIFVLDDIGSLQHMWQKGVNGAGGWGAGHLGGATLGGLGVKLAELGTRMAWMFRE